MLNFTVVFFKIGPSLYFVLHAYFTLTFFILGREPKTTFLTLWAEVSPQLYQFWINLNCKSCMFDRLVLVVYKPVGLAFLPHLKKGNFLPIVDQLFNHRFAHLDLVALSNQNVLCADGNSGQIPQSAEGTFVFCWSYSSSSVAIASSKPIYCDLIKNFTNRFRCKQ